MLISITPMFFVFQGPKAGKYSVHCGAIRGRCPDDIFGCQQTG